jgi:hypothetical protein
VETTNEVLYIDTPQPDGSVLRQVATRWRNPTDRNIELLLHVGGLDLPLGRPPANFFEASGGKVKYLVPALGEALIPRAFDTAIRDVRDGLCVGGLAPALVRLGGSDASPPVHPAISGFTRVRPVHTDPGGGGGDDDELIRLARGAKR